MFASVLPIHDYSATPISAGRPPAKIAALNQWLKQYCTANQCIYLDYYSTMPDRRGMLRSHAKLPSAFTECLQKCIAVDGKSVELRSFGTSRSESRQDTPDEIAGVTEKPALYASA